MRICVSWTCSAYGWLDRPAGGCTEDRVGWSGLLRLGSGGLSLGAIEVGR